MKHRAIFLDRDGVLIRNDVRDGRPRAITVGDSLEILPGVREACAALTNLDYRLAMVTNQPDVATGGTPREFVEKTNAQLARELRLDDVRVCFHDDGANCSCRKPKPGMLLAAARHLDLDLVGSIMIGDRWRDVAAGKAAGCRTIFVDRGYAEPMREPADYTVKSLAEAVLWIHKLSADR